MEIRAGVNVFTLLITSNGISLSIENDLFRKSFFQDLILHLNTKMF